MLNPPKPYRAASVLPSIPAELLIQNCASSSTSRPLHGLDPLTIPLSLIFLLHRFPDGHFRLVFFSIHFLFGDAESQHRTGHPVQWNSLRTPGEFNTSGEAYAPSSTVTVAIR